MAQIVQAWLVAGSVLATHSGRPPQLNEGLAHGSCGQRRTVAVYEERRVVCLRSAAGRALSGILLYGPRELRSKGDQAGLVELRLAHGQYCGSQVDIGQREAKRLPAPQSGAVEHEQQCTEGVRLQLIDPFPIGLHGVEQTAQLVA